MDIEVVKNDLLVKYEEIEESFVEKALPFNKNVRWAALRMEVFFICGLCDLFDCKIVLESGTGHGFSAMLFEKYYRGTDTKVTTIDNTQRWGRDGETWKNIEYLEGDGHTLITEKIIANPDINAGVFIDGPKKEEAYNMAKEYFKYSNVPFVVIHDEGGRKNNLLPELEKVSFYSCDSWFKDRYIYMDIDAMKYLEETNAKKHRWGLNHIMKVTDSCGMGALCLMNEDFKNSIVS